MHDEPDSIESRMLDLQLNRLSPDQIPQVEEVLARDPELAERNRVLGELLEKLDDSESPEPPDDLAEGVMARIEEQTRTIPFEKAASAVPAGSAHELSGSPALSLRELIAIAACITLFVGIFIPGYRKAHNIADRNLCRDHLRQIWQGMSAYSQAHDGDLAWAGYVPGGSWLATRTPNVPRYSNTRPMYLVLRGGYLPDSDPEVFNCPSMPDSRPMYTDDFKQFDDFAEAANVSYSLLLMNTPKPRRVAETDPGMVLFADANPLFDARARRHRISPYDEAGNSLTHEDGAGQNAIYIDGRSGWFATPNIGVDGDNMYRAGRLLRYHGTEVPTSPTDTLVVP